MVALRLLMLGAGRWFPNLVRRLLQRVLITGRADAPFTFRRVLRWVPVPETEPNASDTAGDASAGSSARATIGASAVATVGLAAAVPRGVWRVTDEIGARDWGRVVAAGIGSSQTSIYNVMSRTYQAGQLKPWLDLTAAVRALATGQPLRVEREL
jgi:hypothetical protein